MTKKEKISLAITVIVCALVIVALVFAAIKSTERKTDETETTEMSNEEQSTDTVQPIDPIKPHENTNTQPDKEVKPDIDVGDMTRDPNPSVSDVTIEHGSLEDLK